MDRSQQQRHNNNLTTTHVPTAKTPHNFHDSLLCACCKNTTHNFHESLLNMPTQTHRLKERRKLIGDLQHLPHQRHHFVLQHRRRKTRLRYPAPSIIMVIIRTPCMICASEDVNECACALTHVGGRSDRVRASHSHL